MDYLSLYDVLIFCGKYICIVRREASTLVQGVYYSNCGDHCLVTDCNIMKIAYYRHTYTEIKT